jgi:glycosyltransferase involved in cell wall biosynthesis
LLSDEDEKKLILDPSNGLDRPETAIDSRELVYVNNVIQESKKSNSGISIIISSPEEAQLLTRLLSSFSRINSYQPVELIIVKNSYESLIRKIISRFNEKLCIRQIKNEKRLSVAASYNIGAKEASYPYLLFLAPGIVFNKDVLSLAVAQLQNKEIGIVGMRLDDYPSNLPAYDIPSVLHTGIKFCIVPEKDLFRPVQLSLRNIKEAAMVPSGIYPAVDGAFMLCREEDFKEIGGFCEDYSHGFEFIDFCLLMNSRIQKKTLCINDVSLQCTTHLSFPLEDGTAVQSITSDLILFNLRVGEQIKLMIGQKPSTNTLILSSPICQGSFPAELTQENKSLNIFFVLHQEVNDKSGLHIQAHVNKLTVAGIDCQIAVPKSSKINRVARTISSRVQTFAQIEKSGVSFADGRGPDIVHAWTPRETVRVFCEKIIQRHNCPLIIHLDVNEEFLTETSTGQPFSSMAGWSGRELDSTIPMDSYHPVAGPRFIGRAQGLTMTIHTLSSFNFGRIPNMLLPPPVDEELFYPRPLNNDLRMELGIAEDCLVLAYTGNVDTVNREEIRELYRAVHILNEQGCPTVLIRTGINAVSLGDDSWITAHEKMLGWVERKQIPEILAAADILVQPGISNPHNDKRVPSKLPEFFAMGKPVVLPHANLGLYVENGREGSVLRNANAEEIASTIKTISENDDLKRKLAEGAVEFYLHKIEFGQSEKLKEFYYEISRQGHRTNPERLLTENNTRWNSLIKKINKREKLTIIFVNDNGFTHGAGIALMRQVEVFHSRGHNVFCIAGKNFGHNQHPEDGNFPKVKFLEHLKGRRNLDKEEIKTRLFELISSCNPDLIITGNFHRVGWPVSFLEKLNKSGYPVVAYAHDLYWATGGCAYPMYKDCGYTIKECSDNKCPKAVDEYPPHNPGDISEQSALKLSAFGVKNPVALATNSFWTRKEFKRLYQDTELLIDTIPLPIDTEKFRPADNQDKVREVIGLDKNKFVILAGSCMLTAPGKGDCFLVEIARKFLDWKNVKFIFFGRDTEIELNLPNILSVGYVTNVENLIKYYQAADVFLNPVTIECFGQTMLESLACGTPVICFPVCGVTDVAIDGKTALCPKPEDSEGLENAILELMRNPRLKDELGDNGRDLAVSRFSTKKNYIFWRDYLRKIDFLRRRTVITEYRSGESTAVYRLNEDHRGNCGGLRTRRIAKKNSAELPLITVAIALLDCCDSLEYTILSILDQSYLNIELVIVDGESTDGSLEIVKSYDDYIDFWTSSKDDGVYDAMNRALDIASGEYIIFMGSGDTFVTDDVLLKMMNEAEEASDVLHGHAYWQSVSGEEVLLKSAEFSKKFEAMVQGDFGNRWLNGLPPHQATLMKTKLARMLRFDLGFSVSADWDLLFRAYSYGAKFQLIDEIVANYPGGGSFSKTIRSMDFGCLEDS